MQSQDTVRISRFARGGDRLWPKVVKTYSCWQWIGGTDKDGYGKLRDGQRIHRRAHVYAWWLATEIWPIGGQFVCHTCDETACVRNDDIGTYEVDGALYERRGHLWLGTNAANARDRDIKNRNLTGDQHWTHTQPDRLTTRGEGHPNATLTTALVLEARAHHAAGGNISEFARDRNLSRAAVARAAIRRTWTHI